MTASALARLAVVIDEMRSASEAELEAVHIDTVTDWSNQLDAVLAALGEPPASQDHEDAEILRHSNIIEIAVRNQLRTDAQSS
jgi:hypothetical protein